MKKYAVIVAGGLGLRMGSVLPKQFLLIHDKPILWYTLHAFLKSYKDIHIILVLPAEYFDAGLAICNEFSSVNPIQTVIGGNTRFSSVQQGLSLIREESVIFIHDAVRCLITPSLIHRCFDEAVKFGSAVPCIDSKDSIRIVENGISHTISRSQVKLVQTPQTFLSNRLLPAYQTTYREVFTDDASVLEWMGQEIHVVEGEGNNIKITTPLDLALAEILISPPSHPAK